LGKFLQLVDFIGFSLVEAGGVEETWPDFSNLLTSCHFPLISASKVNSQIVQ
jgi:hypothetical protein